MLLGGPFRAAAGHLAGHARQAPLQFAHPRFTRVFAQHGRQRVARPRHRRGRNAVLRELPRNEVPLGDGELLLVQVSRNADDLHPVAQRLGNAGQRIRRRQEEHLGQVVIDFKKVVVERAVLLGIEHFEQRRRRIAAPVAAQLVHFVQQDHRVDALGTPHGLQDAPGKGADVRAAVSADLRLVANAAQRHAHELASERAGNAPPQRRLAHARRAHQAEDRTLQLADQRQHGDVVDDAFLHLVEPVVILVEDRAGACHVQQVIGPLGPWQRGNPLHVVARHRRLGRNGRHAPNAAQLAVGAGARLCGELPGVQLGFQLAEIVALVVAQFAVNGPELLLQVELALVLEEGPAHVVLDLPLEAQQLRLTGRELGECVKEVHQAWHLEQRLSRFMPHGEVRGDAAPLPFGARGALHQRGDLRRKTAVLGDVLLEQRQRLARLALHAVAGRGEERIWCHVGAQ